ncbi:MAG: extracellular solute-binding protein [Pseudomonadota bacterium]|nr:extracellular solute-binding protein [Pseudomonadota bacterium]
MKTSWRMTRRTALKAGAAASALPLLHVRTGHAAGRLKMAFWDHWVPNANEILRQQVEDWAKKNNVAVEIDFITSSGFKLQTTAAAESQAGTGHDLMTFFTWDAHNYAAKLDPVDDVVKALQGKNGPFNKVSEYLANNKGTWVAVPTSWGSQTKPSCARISLLKQYIGMDVTQLYPAREVKPPEGTDWTYEGTFLKAAEAASKAGKPFALGLGQTSDSVDWCGALFAAYGAELVDKDGKPQVKSDAVREVLEYAQKLVPFLPADAVSYDDASNNRALISGKSALIFNPPSAWAVAKKDAPDVAADSWTFPNPAGPKGRFIPYLGFYWGVWKFSRNKSAAKELIEYLMQRPVVEQREPHTIGYDLPPQNSMTNFEIWSEVEPPKGTVYNYPIRPWHQAEASIAIAPAPTDIAVQIYNGGVMPNMLARLRGGQPVKDVIAWADNQVQGFLEP